MSDEMQKYEYGTLGTIMAKIPWTEVWGRHLALKLSTIRSGFKQKQKEKKEAVAASNQLDLSDLKTELEALGIKKGDILLVHSSFRPLKSFGCSPDEIIGMLIDLVGDEGLLVMPSFVAYEEEISGGFNETSEKEFTYDPKGSKAWTGVITDKFWRRDDVIRSSFPDNSLAARGKRAGELFKNEIDSEMAHDKKSAWEYLREHHAKILFLGIPAFNSITEIHLCEDRLDEQFPVKGWFKERHYIIAEKDGPGYKRVTRIRKQFWSRYLTEYRCSYELSRNGYLREYLYKGINVSLIPDLYSFNEFVEGKAKSGDLIIFRVPKKYYR